MTQTFEDESLQREVLALFAAQVRAALPRLPDLSPDRQADTVHRLKGSARGIGAWAAAKAAAAYEGAPAGPRAEALADLTSVFDATATLIERHLAARTAADR